jgi:hypothetical protein
MSIVEAGAILPLCKMLHVQNAKILRVVLLGIEKLMQNTEEIDDTTVVEAFTVIGGLASLHELAEHEDDEVYELANRIVEMHF